MSAMCERTQWRIGASARRAAIVESPRTHTVGLGQIRPVAAETWHAREAPEPRVSGVAGAAGAQTGGE